MSETETESETNEETQTQSRGAHPRVVKVYPSKDTYDAVGADIDLPTACGELTDNAIDNAGLLSGYADPVTVEFEHRTLDDGAEEIVVRDDSGGIEPDELGVVIGLGQTKKDRAEQRQVGAFGIGAKKALKALGDEFVIRSRHRHEEQGYQYHVPKEWFDDDEAWEFELEETDLDAGVTELRIRELNINWESQVDDIKSWLADTYQLYLGVGPSEVKLDLTLKVDGAAIEPPAPVDWSLSPWDGLHVRQHHGFVFGSRELDEPVEMQVTVGVMTEGSGEQAGTDIFCQDRLVEKANRDKPGGFGAPDGLSQFSLHMHRRFKMQVEFWTTEGGSAKDLPWNSDKSRISPTHPVMLQAYEWMRKVGKRYMTASQYGSTGVNEAFLKPYGAGSEYARDGGVEVIDFSDRWERKQAGKTIRVRDKPERGLPTTKRMEETAEAHADLGIFCDEVGWFEDWMFPAYQELVNEAFDDLSIELGSLTTISAAPPDFTTDGWDVDEEIDRIVESGQAHARDGIRYTGLREWERPRYEAALKAEAERLAVDPSEFEETGTMPGSVEPEVDKDDEGESDGALEGEGDEEERDPGETGEEDLDDHFSGSGMGDDVVVDGRTDDDSDDDSSSIVDDDLPEGATREGDNGSLSLQFSGWNKERLAVVEKHFEDIEELSPESRTELLVNLAKAVEDGRLKFSLSA